MNVIEVVIQAGEWPIAVYLFADEGEPLVAIQCDTEAEAEVEAAALAAEHHVPIVRA